jgi:hypothetical protein
VLVGLGLLTTSLVGTIEVAHANPPPATRPVRASTAHADRLATSIERSIPAGAPAADPGVRSTGAAFVAEVDGVTTQVPIDPSRAITVIAPDGDRLGLRLPGGRLRGEATNAGQGTIVYPGSTGAGYAVQPLAGGGVRALISISDRNAPTEYRFPVQVPAGGAIELVDDGSVEIYDANGVTSFVAAPAWARDATGRAVPTSYRIEGTTLVQIVDHRQFTHPVVADPSIQADCGWVSCTVRLSRSMTRNVRDGVAVLASLVGFCVPLAGPVVCGFIGARLALDRAAAGRYYENGNCLGYRYSRAFPVGPMPIQVRRGTYNCR